MAKVALVLGLLVCAAQGVVHNGGNLVVSRNVVTLGAATTFYCQLPDSTAAADDAVTSCGVRTPSGQTWTVVNGAVTDEDGEAVDGYEGEDNGTPERVCGLTVLAVAEEDLGDWVCVIERSNAASGLLSGVVNLRTEGVVPNIRLPSNTVPTHYDVHLILSLNGIGETGTNDGFVSVAVSVTPGAVAGEDSVTLHKSLSMAIDEVSFSVTEADTGNWLDILEHSYDAERDFYTVRFVRPAGTTGAYNVLVSGNFLGSIPMNGHGIYKDFYTDRDTRERRELITTQYQDIGARTAFPCMDEPGLKATFSTWIGHHTNFSAVSNMPVVSSGQAVPGYQGYVWDKFDASPVMASYLNALTVSEFLSKESVPLPNGLTVLTYARPDAIEDNLADEAAILEPAITDFIGNYYSSPYNLPKLDFLSAPNKGGAMENWGLVIHGDPVLLMDPTQVSAEDHQLVVHIIAHELAHMWFGDLLTTAWWDTIWLNEGFATFVSYLGSEGVAPEMFFQERFFNMEMMPLLISDSSPSSRPTCDDVDHMSEVQFGNVIYNKGATILRMIQSAITEPTMVKALTAYLAENEYQSVTNPDLYVQLNAAAHEDGTLDADLDLGVILETWLEQKNYPLVTVARDGNELTLTQERFLSQEDTSGDDHDYLWWIPVTYSLAGDDFVANAVSYGWFSPEEASVTIDLGADATDVAAVVNVGSYGYYRVNYDADSWALIEQALLTDPASIDRLNRAQIINDVFALAQVDLVSYDLALSIAQYLPQETEYVPLNAALYTLRDLTNIASPPALVQDIVDFLTSVFQDKYLEVGMDANPDHTFLDQMNQIDLVYVLCRSDVQACVDDALAAFTAWTEVADPDDLTTNPVNQQVRAYVYCTAARHDETAADFLLERRTNAFNPQEQDNIAYGLSCSLTSSRAREVVEERLERTQTVLDNPRLTTLLTESSRNREMLLSAVARKSEVMGAGAVVKHVEAIVEAIEHFGHDLRADVRTLRAASTLSAVAANPRLTERLRAAEAAVANNARWSEKNSAGIHRWVKAHLTNNKV